MKATIIAFPAISCGAYGFPIPDAARIAVSTLRPHLASAETLEHVWLCCFTDDVWNACTAALDPRT